MKRRPPDVHLPHDENIPDCIRVDQRGICAVCCEEYRDHQMYVYGDDASPMKLYLVRACDGRFLKL